MKSFDELTFSDNYMFYAVLRKRPDLCKRIVELITGRKVLSIRMLHAEHTVRLTYGGKGIRFDVVFWDNDDIGYDLEMQVESEAALPRRARYYHSMLDLDLLKRGEDYKNLRDSYIIFICRADPFEAARPRYTIEWRCRETGEIVNDGSHTIFLNAKAFERDENPAMQAFLRFVSGGAPEDELTEELANAIRQVRRDEEERHEYMTLQEMIDRECEEARREGLAEGRAEGLEEGLAEGRAEGRAEAEMKFLSILGLTKEDLLALAAEKGISLS